MSLRPQLEALIYAAETLISSPNSLQIYSLVKDSLAAEAPGIEPAEIKSRIRATLEELVAEYSGFGHGIEIRQVRRRIRMSTKPDQTDVVRAFGKSLKPPFRLSLPALETLAVDCLQHTGHGVRDQRIAGVDSGGVIATLLDRKLITTAGRKAVIGRPILYKTSKEFLLRFGLRTSMNCRAWKNSRSCWRESVPERPAASAGTPVEELHLCQNRTESSGAETAAEIAESPEFEFAEETETSVAAKPE